MECFRFHRDPPVTAHVCDDIACMTRGASALCGELEQKLGPTGSPRAGGRVSWQRSACLGLCERAPAALITAAGKSPRECVLAPATVESISITLQDAVNGELPVHADTLNTNISVPQAGASAIATFAARWAGRSGSLEGYRRTGGYEALRRAFEWGAERVIREVIDSKLVGRGGAAFPTGKKWEAVHLQRHLGRPHYVICNADESEPGTFKDRIVMEGDPFAVLEGMTIAAFAVGRGKATLCAWRVPDGRRTAQSRDSNCSRAEVSRRRHSGSGFRFDVEVRRGAGAYICGEETALFNSIEGYRGEPRNKPPFPTQSGLFRQPTGGEQRRDANQYSGNYFGPAVRRTRRLVLRIPPGIGCLRFGKRESAGRVRKRRMGQSSDK